MLTKSSTDFLDLMKRISISHNDLKIALDRYDALLTEMFNKHIMSEVVIVHDEEAEK